MIGKHLTTHVLVWAVGLGAVGCAGDEDVVRRDGGSGGGRDATLTGAGGTGATGRGGGSGTGGTGGTGAGGAASTTGSGGATGTGGTTGTGGRGGTGGTTGTGGATGTGGRGGTGGATGTGGMAGTGAGGAAGTTTCGTIGPANNGTGSFTNYSFGQGTFQESPGLFRTACGYAGHEPSGAGSDTVENIANGMYFAAIPGMSSSNFDSSKYCGACAQITNGGNSVTVTIVDECPEDSNAPCRNNPNGHLDIGVPGFNLLGFSVGNPSGTTWKFVPCPVTGNVIVRIKPGNNNQVFIENSILPIKSVSLGGGQGTRLSYGAWQLPSNVGGQTLVITDSGNRSITVQVPSSTTGLNQNTGQQFPKCQ